MTTRDKAKDNDERHRSIGPTWIGAIMAIACFLFPEGVNMREDYIIFQNYIWKLQTDPFLYFQVSSLGSMAWGLVLYVFGSRLVFANQVMRLYQGKTTGKRVYLASFLAISLELFIFLGNSLSLLLVPDYPYAFSPLPLPILLLIATVLIMVFPPDAKERSWIESEPKEKWWGPKIRNEALEAQISEPETAQARMDVWGVEVMRP
jgi:hypothetical protein